MRTFQMMIDPTKNKKDAAFCQYFKTNTADSKCMYNTANFYIRNTMTGIKKSPEERTHSEIEVLHYVFTGIQRHNNKCMAKIVIYNLKEIGGMIAAAKMHDILSKIIAFPTKQEWFLSYYTLDAIFKINKNPVYVRMNSQVNQNAIRKAVKAWKGYFKTVKDYGKHPEKYTAKPNIPGYKRHTEYTAWFTNQAAKLNEENGQLLGY